MGMNANPAGGDWWHYTFNPWWGCSPVSEACGQGPTWCYAEAWAERTGKHLWGPTAPRWLMGDTYWERPYRWNTEAEWAGESRRVFCMSMGDVFEDRRDLYAPRERLWRVIAETPWLLWLLLTKRPELVGRLTPWGTIWPVNVWLGTTVELQKYAEERIEALLTNPAGTHFVSGEPVLGPLDLIRWLGSPGTLGVNWVIAGGQSCQGARPMDPSWARGLRDQCLQAGALFWMKQMGGHPNKRHLLTDLPEDLRVREVPTGIRTASRLRRQLTVFEERAGAS